MTLILSAAFQTFVIQASDRQVTLLRPNRPNEVYSPVENKVVIFICRDAVGVIGYTGTAYVGGEPTDQWIAKQIISQPAGAPPLGTFGYGIGPTGLHKMHLRGLLERLRRSLASVSLPRGAEVLELLVSGFRVRRGYCSPFHATLEWTAAGPKQTGGGRLPFPPDYSLVAEAGDGFSSDEVMQQIHDGATASGLDGDEAIRQGLISAVRARAGQTTTVGRNVMTVKVNNPNCGRVVEWSFEASEQHLASIVGANGAVTQIPAIFSPWVIGTHVVACPAIGTGSMNIAAGDWIVRGRVPSQPNGSSSTSGILFASSHQKRTGPPR